MRRTRPALVALSSALFLFVFFLGWVSGTVLTGALGLLLLGAGAALLMPISMRQGPWSWAGKAVAGLLAGIIFLTLYEAGIRFLAGRADYLPSELARSQLLRLPYRASVLAGPSWFHLRGLEDIEGLRPDVTVIGLGDIISPQYFRPLRPHHIPLLRYPDIRQPDTGELPDDRKSRFIQQLVRKNSDRSRFFLDMDEDYIHVFMDDVQPWRGLWWSALARQPVGNDCRLMRDTLGQAIGDMLEEPQAITDPEFGRFLRPGFFSWFRVALERRPACPGVARSMLHWWLAWEMPRVEMKPGMMANDMGLVLVRMGEIRRARAMFLQAANAGLPDGMHNAGLASLQTGHPDQAIAWFRRAFVEHGDRAAWEIYRKLMHGSRNP